MLFVCYKFNVQVVEDRHMNGFGICLLGVFVVMPKGGSRVNCNLCGEEQYTRNMNRHLYRAHQIGEWKTGYSAIQSEVTSRASSPATVVNIPDHPSRHSQAVLPNTNSASNVNMVDDVHVATSADINCHPPVSSCIPKTVGLQQSPDVHLVNSGNRDGTLSNLSRVESDMLDNRTVVSRVQRVSCVCEPDVSGDSFECDIPHILCSDSMNWLLGMLFFACCVETRTITWQR